LQYFYTIKRTFTTNSTVTRKPQGS